MKEKFEAVTGSRKSSVRSTSGGDRPGLPDMDGDNEDNGGGIKKLAENRKLLLEQKLGGGERGFCRRRGSFPSTTVRTRFARIPHTRAFPLKAS